MIAPSEMGPQGTLYPQHLFLSEEVNVSKSGEVGMVLHLRGVDPESLTDEMLEDLHTRLVPTFNQFDKRYRVMQYLVKHDGADLEMGEHENPVVKETIQARTRFLVGKPLSTIDLYWVIFNAHKKRPWTPLTPRRVRFSTRKLQNQAGLLKSRVVALANAAGGALGITLLTKQKAFEFFRFLASLDKATAQAETLQYDDHVDYWMASVPQAYRDGYVPLGKVEAEVLSLRKAPKGTFPNVLRELLRIKGNFMLCSSFHQESINETTLVINKKQQHFNIVKWVKSPGAFLTMAAQRGSTEGVVPDQAAQDIIDELARTTTRVKTGGDPMGKYSLTAIAFEKDNRERLESTAQDLQKVFGELQGSLVLEEGWAYGAYLSCFPGTLLGRNFRQREFRLPASQALDMAFLYNHRMGSKINEHLGKESLLVLETVDGTPYEFNLHERDRLGVVGVGESGSGKSFFSNLCLDHGMKFDPYVLILDGLGNSYETLTRKHNGQYYNLDPDGNWGFSFNPFTELDSRKTRQYLAMLLRVLMVAGGYKPDAEKNQIVFDAVGRVMDLPFEERRISRVELPAKIAVFLTPWIGNGQYGFLFDNAKDTFALGKFQTIDFSLLEEFPDIVQPVLFHVFHLWARIVQDPNLLLTPKTMFVDECWKMLTYPAARRQIPVSARMWRRYNAGIAIYSQSIQELDKSGVASIVNELFPTKILFSNPGADYKHYAEFFKLNEAELLAYKRLSGKGDMFVKTPTYSKTLKISADPLAALTYFNDHVHNDLRNRSIAKYGPVEGLRRLSEMVTA